MVVVVVVLYSIHSILSSPADPVNLRELAYAAPRFYGPCNETCCGRRAVERSLSLVAPAHDDCMFFCVRVSRSRMQDDTRGARSLQSEKIYSIPTTFRYTRRHTPLRLAHVGTLAAGALAGSHVIFLTKAHAIRRFAVVGGRCARFNRTTDKHTGAHARGLRQPY